MDWLITPFSSNNFMLHALLAGVLVAISCAIVGTFVVLRGMAFIGDALAHGVLPGIAGSMLLGYSGMAGAVVGAAAMIGGISLITQRSRLSSDTAIGLLFVGMLALGVLIISRSNSFSGDLTRILFGEILGVSTRAIFIQLGATLVVAAIAAICSRPFLLLCFDAEQAQVMGFSVRLYHNAMLFLIALTIVVSFQTVGTLLVFGMLLAPAGAGALLARRIGSMIAWAAILGISSVYVGLLLSYHFDIAAGAAVVLTAITIFFAVFLVQNLRSQHSRSSEAALHE
ncbi:MAG: metal ABC transporter permease [Dehalococcoidia bacterium]